MSQENAFSTGDTLTRDEIVARVLPILAEEAGMPPDDLRESHLLEEDLMFDSLMTIESVMELEDEFDMQVPDEAAQGMRTVGDVIDGMCKLLEGQSG